MTRVHIMSLWKSQRQYADPHLRSGHKKRRLLRVRFVSEHRFLA